MSTNMNQSMDNAEMLRILQHKRPTHIAIVWKAFSASKAAVAGLVVVVLLFAAAFGAPLIMPYAQAIQQNIHDKFTAPGSEFILGTDNLGRDVVARLLHGARVSLTMGFIPTIASLVLGMLLGGIAVYSGGRTENIIMRICDLLSSIPAVLLALALVAALGTGLFNVMIAITIASIPDMTRYVRSVILNIIGLEYIDAARACGTSGPAIVVRHVLPNAVGPLILSAVTNISSMIMIGAGLSYLGLGIQPPQPEWGNMLAEGQSYFIRAPWLMIAPGLAILISVLSFNLMGDGLRDALDPKLR